MLLMFDGRKELQLARQSEIGVGNAQKHIGEALRRCGIIRARSILLRKLATIVGFEHSAPKES
ncbi:hypothetical protein XF30_22760 [Bradyrhizobium sp. SUTN9-2]|nr:hypothetical protein XF30_22760 [Bradyrhizobium sp. SUTN9-2]